MSPSSLSFAASKPFRKGCLAAFVGERRARRQHSTAPGRAVPARGLRKAAMLKGPGLAQGASPECPTLESRRVGRAGFGPGVCGDQVFLLEATLLH